MEVPLLRGYAAAGYTVAGYPEHVAIADVTGDGKADIVTGNFTGASIAVLAGTGGGNFAAAVAYSTGVTGFGDTSGAISIGDLDHDGDLDVTYVGYNNSSNAGTLIVMTNSSTGSFTATNTVGTGTATTDVTIADFAGDGYPDVVALDHSQESALVFANTCH